MDTLPDIPGHEHLVSHVEYDGLALAFRLVTDIHPGYAAHAYWLRAARPSAPEAAVAFLQRAQTERDFVFAFWTGRTLSLATESGEEFKLSAERFEGALDQPNAAELRSALERVFEWYTAGNEMAAHLNSKLQRVRELLLDQASRVRVKAATHPTDSSVGVLYAQQLAFIERLIREAEA